jgi:hypothetical protein
MRRIILAAVAFCGSNFANDDVMGLRDLIWTNPTSDRASILTHSPAERLKTPASASIEAGGALF